MTTIHDRPRYLTQAEAEIAIGEYFAPNYAALDAERNRQAKRARMIRLCALMFVAAFFVAICVGG